MKIIGIFILILELLALALQIRSECKKNNITIYKAREKFNDLKNKYKPMQETKLSLYKWRTKK